MNKKNARPITSFDYAIKTVLRDKANSGVPEGFLSALLNQTIKVMDLLESESNRPWLHGQTGAVSVVNSVADTR